MKHSDLTQVDSTVSVVNYTTGAQTSILPAGPGLPGDTVAAVPYFNTKRAGGMAVASAITVDTNATATFTSGNVGTNTITLTAHGLKTGLLVTLTTSGALPTGLATSTPYYAIAVNANTISLATSQANAIAGTVITFTATGATGTSHVVPTALSGATVTPQWSLDGVTWNNLASATSITVTTVFSTSQDRPTWPYFRLSFAITAGSLTLATTYYSYFEN